MTQVAKRPDGVERGDHVYVQHPTRGPMAVKVLACGEHGLTGKCEQGQRHKVPWNRFLGHKARLLNRYKLVEQGADGAILEDEKGRRRYVAGEVPAGTKAPKEPVESGRDDPLLGGMGRLGKAMRGETTMPHELPAGACILFLKADSAAGKSGRALMRHGDIVTFRHQDVEGEGKIVASGADGVTVQGEDGREHQIRHEHLVPPAAGKGGAGKGTPRKKKGDGLQKALERVEGSGARVMILAAERAS